MKIEKEQRMVTFMIELYCKHEHHTKGGLCKECAELIAYAQNRLLHCPFGEKKSSCKRCPIHCYSPQMRKRIAKVMRKVAPRMFFIAPIASFRHIFK